MSIERANRKAAKQKKKQLRIIVCKQLILPQLGRVGIDKSTHHEAQRKIDDFKLQLRPRKGVPRYRPCGDTCGKMLIGVLSLWLTCVF